MIGLGIKKKEDPLTRMTEHKLSQLIDISHNYFRGWKKTIFKLTTAV